MFVTRYHIGYISYHLRRAGRRSSNTCLYRNVFLKCFGDSVDILIVGNSDVYIETYLKNLAVQRRPFSSGKTEPIDVVLSSAKQGCQIFICPTYQNGKKYAKMTTIIYIPNGNRIYQMAIKYTKWQ
jgi:hypothetical protein